MIMVMISRDLDGYSTAVRQDKYCIMLTIGSTAMSFGQIFKSGHEIWLGGLMCVFWYTMTSWDLLVNGDSLFSLGITLGALIIMS